MLAASNTGVSTSATVLVAPVLATMVLVAGSTGATGTRASSTGATLIEAPVLLTMCYNAAQNTLLMVQFAELLAQCFMVQVV